MKKLWFALAMFVLSGAALATVNLNTASKDELVGLPGIGPHKAQAIVDYRTTHGPFKSVEDVRKVKGIGEKLYLQIKPEIAVAGGAAKVAAAPAASSKPDPAAGRAEAGRKEEKARK